MKRSVLGIGLLAALLLALPAAADDKKEKTNPASPADYQALLEARTVTGKLTATGGSDKTLSLRVEYEVAQPNPNYKGNNAALNRLLHEQQQILRSRNPYQQAARLEKLQQDILKEQAREANAVKFVKHTKDFDLGSAPKVVVRTLELPAEYDDKGNPKKYTAAELQELKGDNPDLPGYTSDFDKLRAGQTVRITLVKPKADKEKDKDATPEEKKPQVSRIVIVHDAPADAPAKGKKDK
jgi:hypothetical protein